MKNLWKLPVPVVALLGLAVLLVGIFLPAWAYDNMGGGEEISETTTITSYHANFVIDRNGDLSATETISVFFPASGLHGIFRFWDLDDSSAPHKRRAPYNISVTRDGHQEAFELSSHNTRYQVAKIGDPNETLTPGVHYYQLRYHIRSVLEPGQTPGRSQLYWNLIPGGWQQRIEAADLTVHLPAPAGPIQCAVGFGATTDCSATGEGTTTLHVVTAELPPQTPVTIRTSLPLTPPDANTTYLWSARFDPVLGRSLIGLVVVLLLAGIAGFTGALLSIRAREPAPAFPLQYGPPPGMTPAQAAYVLNEQTDSNAFIATLMHAAQGGAVRLEQSGASWTLSDNANPAAWQQLDPITRDTVSSLIIPFGWFTADPQNALAGGQLKEALTIFTDQVRQWGLAQRIVRRNGLGLLWLVLVGLFALPFSIYLAFKLNMSIIVLIPGLYLVAGCWGFAPGAGTKHTPAGRELWSQVGGFWRVLSTPSSIQRFNFSGRQALYLAYLPWAVAFDCAQEWSEKYRLETQTEPPVPYYVGGLTSAGLFSGTDTTSMIDSFSRTLDSSISSYEASQTSSSGSGSSSSGGFSGGGGGGGGGGGSW